MKKEIEARALEMRSFNRFYTHIIGLVNQTILESSYSLAEARILLEIDRGKECTAADLIDSLQIDGGYLSRIIKKFVRGQLVQKEKSSADGRIQVLSLTKEGREVVRKLYQDSTDQAGQILEKLPEISQAELIQHMRQIRNLLNPKEQQINIRSPKEGDLSYMAYRHCVLYKREYGLDGVFEKYVLEGLYKYLEEKPIGKIWVAECEGEIIGSIAIVGSDDKEAQLRWFLIEPEFRSSGIGRKLMEEAIHFCMKKGFQKVFLWTFTDLKAARHLYHSFGFALVEEVPNDIWRSGLIEEKWEKSFVQ